jgi:dihydropteroate synthase
VATAVWALLRGAAMVRVHDVAATVRALEAVDAVTASAA